MEAMDSRLWLLRTNSNGWVANRKLVPFQRELQASMFSKEERDNMLLKVRRAVRMKNLIKTCLMMIMVR